MLNFFPQQYEVKQIWFCTIWNLLQVQIINRSEETSTKLANIPKTTQRYNNSEDETKTKNCTATKRKPEQQETTKRANQRFKKQNQAATNVATSHQRQQRRRDLIWDKKFVPTQQLWSSTRPNAAPSPPHPPRTSSSSGVRRGLLSASLFSFLTFFCQLQTEPLPNFPHTFVFSFTFSKAVARTCLLFSFIFLQLL